MTPNRNKRIFNLDLYRRPAPQGDYFSDLPYEAQQRAQRLLWKWCQKWGTDLPPWRLAILVARARRLALHPLDSAWGKRLRCRRGGLAAQKNYRLRGINPTAKATEARRRKLQANPPQPQRRAGAVYTLPPGVLPGRTMTNHVSLL
ncbi:MAG: hypothetical protein RB191_23490 [Terriglobia bacterium]|nr:hypothetical protein [Terriglobia bacterium]